MLEGASDMFTVSGAQDEREGSGERWDWRVRARLRRLSIRIMISKMWVQGIKSWWLSWTWRAGKRILKARRGVGRLPYLPHWDIMWDWLYYMRDGQDRTSTNMVLYCNPQSFYRVISPRNKDDFKWMDWLRIDGRRGRVRCERKLQYLEIRVSS